MDDVELPSGEALNEPDSSSATGIINVNGTRRPWRMRHPEWATWYGALCLAGAWTGVFMIVFFISTLFLNLQTHVVNFFVALWLSIIAEVFIRWLENCNAAAAFSKPLEREPVGDNTDFSLSYMWQLLVLGLFIFVLALVVIVLAGYEFQSLEVQSSMGTFHGPIFEECSTTDPIVCSQGDPDFKRMFATWWDSMFAWKFALPFVICVLMRARVYKRKVHCSG